MRFLSVIGWHDYQHYKNRRAPWIKAYTDILDALEHPKFTKLSDGAKLTLHHLRLLAGVTGNRIPETWVTSGHLNMHTKPRVTELVDAGFVEWVELASEQPDGSLASTDQNEGKTQRGPRARGRARSQNSLSSQTGVLPENEGEKPTRAHARDLVEKFAVTQRHREWAAEKVPGVDVDVATDSWRDHLRTNGYRTRAGPVSDVDASWRNWMRNEVKFSRGRYGHGNGNGSARAGSTGSERPAVADASEPRLPIVVNTRRIAD
ncbi:MAG TPA: hypothetical protein VNL91_09150 [Thermoanaerobaculia bacterium]|nr:hypothetical protein [Thermoanaerobaculia bacterium]